MRPGDSIGRMRSATSMSGVGGPPSQDLIEEREDLITSSNRGFSVTVDEMRSHHAVRDSNEVTEEGWGSGFAASSGRTVGMNRSPRAAR
jgi:hypothetical protein